MSNNLVLVVSILNDSMTHPYLIKNQKENIVLKHFIKWRTNKYIFNTCYILFEHQSTKYLVYVFSYFLILAVYIGLELLEKISKILSTN